MEDLKQNPKYLYFIYSQNTLINNIVQIEKNKAVKEIKIIEEKTLDYFFYVLYCLELSDDYINKPFTVTLINHELDLYYKNVYPKIPGEFKYDMKFNLFQKEKKNSLSQIILVYKDQLLIFENYLKQKNDIKSINNLFLDSINYLTEINNPDVDYNFIVLLFIEIYQQYKNTQNNLFKDTIKKYFEQLNFQLFENKNKNNIEGLDKPNLNLNSKYLEIFSDNKNNIRQELISLTGDKEEINVKIDAFLGFYYLFYEPKLFLNFVKITSDNETFKVIKYHLFLHNSLFNNFNSQVFSFDLFNEVKSYTEMEIVIKNFVPNMVELLKIFVNEEIFIKMMELSALENRLIPITDLCCPKKEDNIKELLECFEQYISLCNQEKRFIVRINADFFLQYCKLFLNVDYEKIDIIHAMLNRYNSNINKQYRIKIDDQIDNYYHDTGMYLISNQKLINNNAFDFLKQDEYFKNQKNPIPFDLICRGIIFSEDDEKYVNDFLNNNLDDFDMIEFFGNQYPTFYKHIFNRFQKPRDLLCLYNWDINYNVDKAILTVFLDKLVLIWKDNPNNHMIRLESLIGNALGKASQILDDYKKYITQLENNVSSDSLMIIYNEILYRDFSLLPEFQDHIVDYMNKHIGTNPLSIWYKTNIIKVVEDDQDKENDYLENNLKEEYAVQAEHFVSYPANIDEKILLFTSLYKAKYFVRFENLTELPYYTKSIDSKDNIYKLKFEEVMKMYKNITEFQNLFIFFIPGPYYRENEFIVDSILINFSEKCGQAKNFYDALEKINNYWKMFFSTEKQDEIIALEELMTNFKNSPLQNCEKFLESHSFYLKFKDKAYEVEKLMNRNFFMEIYNSSQVKDKSENERFNYAYEQFNQLKQLETDFTLNALGKDLKNILAKFIYENGEDAFDDELKFIISFFNFKWNNFNTSTIKRHLKKLVQQYQIDHNLKDKSIFKDDEKKVLEKIEEQFVEKLKLENEITEEIKSLIKDINTLAKDYFLKSKMYENNNELNINEDFKNFYMKLFETNYGLCKIEIPELIKIITFSNEMYINAVGLGLMNKYTDNSLSLISEYNDIYKAIRHQNKLTKSIDGGTSKIASFFILLKNIKIYDKTTKEGNDGKLKECINNLFDLAKESVKEEKINDLLNKILINEKKKNSNVNFIDTLFEIILRKDGKEFAYIYNNNLPIPFIDEVFYGRNEDQINFESRYIIKINNLCDEKKIFEEMILFYFESKIMMMLDKKYTNVGNLINENTLETLKNYFTYLYTYKTDYNRRNTTKKLYNIAFIKCFFYKLINYLCNDNQGDISEIIQLINQITFNFKKTMKIYTLKLFFDYVGNYNDFKFFNFSAYQIDFNVNDRDLESIINKDILESDTNSFGFDFLFLPVKQNHEQNDIIYNIKEKNNKDYSVLLKNLLDISNNKPKNNPNLNEIINNNNDKDIDFLYCGLLNIQFSNYYKDKYFNKEQYKNINNWINEIISNKEINILKDNEIISKILLLFNEGKFNNIKGNINRLSYEQLLCILISARYVLNTISSNNKEGLFYKLVLEPQKTISDYNKFFHNYLRDFETICQKQIEINYLTYRFINYIILSHIYFGFLLGNIDNIDSIYELLSLPLPAEDKTFLSLLFEEFDFINNNILKIIGIKKIIIFMNYIFEQVSNIIININSDKDDNYNKQIADIDNSIINKITKFDKCVEDYYQKKKELSENVGDNNEKGQIWKNIIYEDDIFYNSEKTERDYSFITYLTTTNFCTFEDFKNQYLYNEYIEGRNYPMIDCIINNNNIIELVDLIPKFNKYINDIYNKLLFKIKKDDSNKEIKDIKDLINLEDINIVQFNELLQKIIKILNYGDKIKISKISKVSDIINIKDNIIYKIYSEIIKRYNAFLTKNKIYKENEDIIEALIIQNASENDFISFNTNKANRNMNNNETKNISAKDRLCEIICLYSKRNRIQIEKKGENIYEKINVYDGGRIIYDYNMIENKLEEEFIYGKKKLSEIQKIFIFSDDLFNDNLNNILKEVNKKYKQTIIDSDISLNIDTNLANDDKIGENNLIDFYHNLQYVIMHLITFEKDNKYIDTETHVNDIVKIISKENFKLNDNFILFMKQFSDSLFIKHLYSFYEKIELDVFKYLTKDINVKMAENELKISDEKKGEIEKLLNDNKELGESILINGIEKYILRYCLGDKNKIKDIIKINNIISDIFSIEDIWGDTIFNNKDFKDESNKIISINQNDNNCVLKYCYNIIFKYDKNNVNIQIEGEQDDAFKDAEP